MRAPLVIGIAVLAIGALPAPVFAHGGGLDSAGGHHNRRTGEYHYHRAPSRPSPPASPVQTGQRTYEARTDPPAATARRAATQSHEWRPISQAPSTAPTAAPASTPISATRFRTTARAIPEASSGLPTPLVVLIILVVVAAAVMIALYGRTTKRPLNRCATCGHSWFPRGRDRAGRCPSCRSTLVSLD